jgi:hypothetical protein
MIWSGGLCCLGKRLLFAPLWPYSKLTVCCCCDVQTPNVVPNRTPARGLHSDTYVVCDGSCVVQVTFAVSGYIKLLACRLELGDAIDD